MLRRYGILILTLALAVSPVRALAAGPQSGGRDGVTIYLGNRSEYPSLIEVQLFTPADDHPLTTAVNGLITGIQSAAPFRSLLPVGTELNGAAVSNGLATLDFSSEILRANVGSLGEAMLLASIVDTAVQFPTVQSVQLLVDGALVDSIAGHILASEPLAPDFAFRPQGFADAARHWAERQINAMALRGVINGYPDKTYRPERAVTRAEIIKLITAASGEIDWSTTTQSFADVAATHPLYAYIETAIKRGILIPADYAQTDGTCRLTPDGNCTRREAAVMSVRAAGATARATELAGQPLPWTDTATQPAWAGGYLLAASERGLMKGYPDGSFRPAGTLTRAEAATVVARLIGCAPGPVIAAAVRSSEACGTQGLLVAGVCPGDALLRIDIRDAGGTILSSHSLSLRKITDSCSYFAAIMPAAQLQLTATQADVLVLSGADVIDRWSVAIPPR